MLNLNKTCETAYDLIHLCFCCAKPGLFCDSVCQKIGFFYTLVYSQLLHNLSYFAVMFSGSGLQPLSESYGKAYVHTVCTI